MEANKIETVYYADFRYLKEGIKYSVNKLKVLEETPLHLIVQNHFANHTFVIKREDLDKPYGAYHTTKLHALVSMKGRARDEISIARDSITSYQEILYDLEKEMQNH